MTSAPAAPPVEADASTGPPTETTTSEGFFRRNRIWFAVGIAVAVALVVAAWAGQGDEQYGDPLDPQNSDPDGARAVAQVLEHEGVEVAIVRSADDLHGAGADGDATVLVTGTDELAPSTLRRLRADTRGADVVLVEPPEHLLDALEGDEVPVGQAPDETTGECGNPRFDELTITVDTAYAYDTAEGCFPSRAGFVLARGPGLTSYLGAGQALTNDQVLRGDNAAVALRLLGQHDRLVWYVPTYDDADDDETLTLWSFAPAWLVPSLWLVAVAVLTLIWWRARRLGRLASEPLPVVVRAVETTRSRGRMYRRADDRPYAAAALRAATRRGLAEHLRLGRGASEAEVVAAVARHLGRRDDEVRALLDTQAPVPGSDQDLVALAQELTQLMREVRRG